MSRKAKGKRPIYFDNPECDKLLAIIMAIAGELSVVRERQDTLERLLESKGLVSAAEIEGYRPDESVTESRDKWRAEYLGRILRIVHDDIESIENGETPESYGRAIEEVSR
ncbi:MAG: hypothetical protein ACREP6_11040 [Candidatus Binataceae bacterium]